MTNMASMNKMSNSEYVVESIRASIQRGDLKIGSKLPNEEELAKQLGVGRSSLREGMRVLAAHGIVEIRQGDGTFISDKYSKQAFSFLGFYPSKENMTYLLQVRSILETGCLKEVFFKLTSDEVATLKNYCTFLEDCSLFDAIEADAKFHEFFITKTSNPILKQIYKMMSDMLGMIFKQLMSRPDVYSDACSAHQRIVDALEKKDLEAGVAALASHLQQVSYYAEKYLS